MNEPEPEPGCFGRGRGLGRVHGINATERRYESASSYPTSAFAVRRTIRSRIAVSSSSLGGLIGTKRTGSAPPTCAAARNGSSRSRTTWRLLGLAPPVPAERRGGRRRSDAASPAARSPARRGRGRSSGSSRGGSGRWGGSGGEGRAGARRRPRRVRSEGASAAAGEGDGRGHDHDPDHGRDHDLYPGRDHEPDLASDQSSRGFRRRSGPIARDEPAARRTSALTALASAPIRRTRLSRSNTIRRTCAQSGAGSNGRS